MIGFGLVILATGWLFGGGIQRDAVEVQEALLSSAERLTLIVASCNANPEVTKVVETAVAVKVRVIASSQPPGRSDDCQDPVDVQLQDPLGDRAVIDLHTNERVDITTIDLIYQ